MVNFNRTSSTEMPSGSDREGDTRSLILIAEALTVAALALLQSLVPVSL
jgi:hypothetical protein